jgi:hypothetical protein
MPSTRSRHWVRWLLVTVAALVVLAVAGPFEVAGDIPVLFSDYNIQNPSFAGFVTTQDHGLLEFLLILNQA